jgi:hypothetical protein
MLDLIQSKIYCLLISYNNLKIKTHKIVMSPSVLYGCETWFLTLREEYRLRVFENRVLRRIFGLKRGEDRSWRKLHNDELHGLYFSPTIVRVIKWRRMRWTGHVARMGEGRSVYRVLIGGSKWKEPPGRPGRRWEDKIEMDLNGDSNRLDELNSAGSG